MCTASTLERCPNANMWRRTGVAITRRGHPSFGARRRRRPCCRCRATRHTGVQASVRNTIYASVIINVARGAFGRLRSGAHTVQRICSSLETKIRAWRTRTIDRAVAGCAAVREVMLQYNCARCPRPDWPCARTPSPGPAAPRRFCPRSPLNGAAAIDMELDGRAHTLVPRCRRTRVRMREKLISNFP